HELQEFACDEAVAGHPAVSTQAYARCLLEVAETAIGLRPASAGTVALAGDSDGSSLRRRIMRLISMKERKAVRSGRMILAALLLASVLTAGSLVARAVGSGRTLTLEEAQLYAQKAGGEKAAIPLTMNARVLTRLNKMIGTPEGRKWAQGAL